MFFLLLFILCLGKMNIAEDVQTKQWKLEIMLWRRDKHAVALLIDIDYWYTTVAGFAPRQ